MSRNEPTPPASAARSCNVSSVAAFDGQIGQAAYAASKGGLVGLTLPVARDLAASAIRLNTVAPGLIDTPIYDFAPEPEAFKEQLGQSVLFPKRLGTPDELAAWCSLPHQHLHERRDDPRRRRHPDAPEVVPPLGGSSPPSR